MRLSLGLSLRQGVEAARAAGGGVAAGPGLWTSPGNPSRCLFALQRYPERLLPRASQGGGGGGGGATISVPALGVILASLIFAFVVLRPRRDGPATMRFYSAGKLAN